MSNARERADFASQAAILDQLGDKPAPPDPFADDVSTAWQLHIDNKNEAALDRFEKILQQDANHMDALYGKALTLESLDRKPDAIADLEKLLGLVDTIRENMPGRSAILTRLAKQKIKWMQAH